MTSLRVIALLTLLGVTLVLPGAGGPLAAGALWAVCVALLVRSSATGILSLAPLYLAVLGAFHVGLVVPHALGLLGTDVPSWLRSSAMGTALGLFSTAAVAYTLGATRPRPAAPLPEAAMPAQQELFLAGCCVAVVGAALLWAGVRQLGFLSRGYSAYFELATSSDVRLFGFGMMLFPMGLLVAAAGATPRGMILLGAMLAAVLGPLALRGFRGPFLVHSIALLAIWARKDRRVARGLALAVAAVAISLLPLIRMTRNLDADGSRSRERPALLLVLAETGGSLYPLVATAERVESGAERLWMGESYAMALKRIVPNVAERWSRPSNPMIPPNAWLTKLADPWLYEHGGGFGYSGVAEPYLNFGRPGVVLFFFLLGIVIRTWDRWLATDPFRAAIAAASFGFVLWTTRNDAMELPRDVAYTAVIGLAAWLAARLRRATAPSAAPAGEAGP